MATKKKKKPRLQRTIAEELHAEWTKLYRKNDTTEIAKILDVSKPTIDNAIIYGCVHQQMIIDGINKYFSDRLNREKEQAEQLRGLQNPVNGSLVNNDSTPQS